MRSKDVKQLLSVDVLENLPFPVSIHSADFTIVYANRKFKDLFGEDSIGKKCYETVHGTDRPIKQCPHAMMLKGGKTHHEVIYEKKYDQYWEVITTPLKEGGDALGGSLHIVLDITDKKLAEISLARERNLLSKILQTLGALVVILDKKGRIVLFNRACEEITGYSEREVRGARIFDLLIPEEDREGVERVFSNLSSGVLPSEYENHWLTKRGERRLISWRNTIVTDDSGEVEYIIGTGVDITEQRRYERSMKEELRKRTAINEIALSLLSTDSSEKMYENLLVHISYLLGGGVYFIAIAREDGTMEIPAALGPEELVNRLKGVRFPMEDCVHLRGLFTGETIIIEDLSQLSCESQLFALLGESPFKMTFRAMAIFPIQTQEGFLGSIYIMSESDKEIVRQNIPYITDLLPTLALVFKHRLLLDKVEELNEELRAANESLKLITKTLRHDILNQTTILRGYVDLYLRKGDKGYFEKMKGIIERVERLIEEMKSLELLAGMEHEGLKPINIGEIVKEIRGIYNVEIAYNGDCTVMADEGLASLFQNLVHNSIIHGNAARVEIENIEEGDKCRITVRDNGSGIPHEIRENIFDEGFSYGRGGTGLGLYLAKKAVERYGGSIKLLDTGDGAAFEIILKSARGGGYQHS